MEPQRLDHYELLELLGEGGMARVYRARDARLDRIVAIKVLNEQVSRSARTAARFQREARLAASLRHPNVVTVHDCSPPESDTCYLVTELITGGSLRDRMTAPLLAEEAAVVCLPVARALAAAHVKGIVHRDVKPENILIDRTERREHEHEHEHEHDHSGERASIKLADFGVALVTTEPRITTDGSVSGSLAYMAPEQIREGEVIPASDVWSLGITLYELIHGQVPFAGRTVGHLVAQILGQKPAMVEERIDRTLLSPELWRVLVRCLQLDPAQRYPDGAALAEEVEAALGQAGIARPEQELRSWAESDPKTYRAGLARRVADHLVARADGQPLERSADLLDRALALVPNHPGALALLGNEEGEQKLPPVEAEHARPPQIRLGRVLAAGLVLLAAVGVLGLWAFRSSRRSSKIVEAPAALVEGTEAGTDAAAERDPGRAAAPGPDLGEPRDTSRGDRPLGAPPRSRWGTSRRRRGFRAATDRGTLQITTEPWAEVLVDGKSMGYTPKLRRIELSAGLHRLVLRNPLCRPRTTKIAIPADEIVIRHVKLEVLPARLELKAPPGWNVFIDGRLVGKTPLPPINLTHGSHQLRAARPSGEQRLRKVRVTAGRTTTLDLGEDSK